jgi:hypothetical protein
MGLVGAGPGVDGEKEVGVGTQVRSRRATIVSWVGLGGVGALVGTGVEAARAGCGGRCGGRGEGRDFFRELRRCNRDGQRIGDGLGAGVEAARRKWVQVRRRGGRDFFRELRRCNRDGQRMGLVLA